MPSTDFTDLRAAIETKLNTVSNLQVVYPYHTGDIEGWPAATFEPSGNTGLLYTNDDNLREYNFTIALLQEMEIAGRDKAIEILCETVDAVISAFDEDFNLGGTCHFMRAAPSDWSEVTAENGSIKVALIDITCIKEVTVI